MIVYLDTSAAVKLYVTEAGSEAVRHAVASASEAATSLLAYAEDRDWAHFNQLPVGSETVRLAGDSAERFGLRGYDAVHLASAYLLYREIRFTVSFACFDLALNSAASSLGLSLFVN